MKTYETKNNSGTLGDNDRKTTDRHPDKKGKALIDGRWFWISGWNKSSQRGEFLSLSFEQMTDEQADKYGGGQQQTPPPTRRPAPPPRQPEPGYDSGPPAGTYQANRAASKAPAAPAAPAPSEYPDAFQHDDIPF